MSNQPFFLAHAYQMLFPFLAYFSVQGKRALKKDAARRKPSEVKSQIEVLANAFRLCDQS